MTLPILILAAGQSSRMRGTDKLLEQIDGVALLRRQIDAAGGVGDVFVALPAADHPRAALLQNTDAQAIIVSDAADGMGVTLRRAVHALPPCPSFMVLLADLAEITATDLQAIVNARKNHPDNLIWRGATAAGKPGHPIMFDASLRPEFETLSGDTGGSPILKAHRSQTHLVALQGNRALLDLDTPEEWAQWRAARRS
ncbi:CTP:molybdopterin cytidylyltransferase MocA [Loktanella ponticola]|uniref:CTP:molybdopterin cytidylyltransferase MocA n=1 Tax=Yoonia ponticola TaxID=1524255 RepID=A0A7W9BP35_9RHOB|nr:nucleotidyltransferase family protein [Yoonia ponticola]MBB5724041.1 CTP:molybdopterin cytidylyltransferase MocA [Yoonia ponticola]